MSVVRAVLFDADGVFQRTPASTLRAIEALTDRPDKGAFLQAIWEAEERHIVERTPLFPAWSAILSAWGCTADAAHLQQLWHDIELDHGVLELVAEVRGGGRLACIASNQMESRGIHMSRTLGLTAHFDREFYAYELRCLKPNPGFFYAMTQSLGLAPSQCLFIDDREQNTLAAESIGMRVHHFLANAGADAMRRVLARHGVLGGTDVAERS